MNVCVCVCVASKIDREFVPMYVPDSACVCVCTCVCT